MIDFFTGMRYILHMNNWKRTEEKVFSYMEEHSMTAPGHKIVAGVSGGADSVCLLFVLREYAGRIPLGLAVVHVDHGLREDSAEDAEFVGELCRQLGVSFYLRKVDVKTFAEREKCSLEEAARILRYRAFQEVAEEFGADRIAVAHSANDRAETMLFHLFRGSGIKGLCAIPPRREQIIRPLMCLERGEIEYYLTERGISYRTDSTNNGDFYTRNRIRHHILPVAEQEVSARTVAHMCRTADMLSELEEYLELQTLDARKNCVEPPTVDSAPFIINVERFRQLHIALRKRLLLALLKELVPGGRDISVVHVEDVLALFEKKGNPHIDLPFAIRAVRRYDVVSLEREQEPCKKTECPLHQEIELPTGETLEPLLFDLGTVGQVVISVFYVKNGQKVPRNEYTKWLDCDKILESLVFRYRQTGDYLSLADGRGGTIHKSLKDYMINEKIPREDRDRMLLLAEGKHVVWLTGYRISEYYKVNENTKRILQVKLIRNCPGSGTEEKDGGTH